MLEPVFSGETKQDDEKTVVNSSPIPKPPETPHIHQPKKIAKRSSKNRGIPSIKDALEGKMEDEQISAKEQHQIYNQADEKEDFSIAELKEKWEQFVGRLDERPSLKSSLSTLPEITDDFKLILEIDNRIQEDLIGSIKPELVSWLRRELKNSRIQLVTKITEKLKGKIIYTDSEKFEEMAKKNPQLERLRNKFKLDFGG